MNARTNPVETEAQSGAKTQNQLHSKKPVSFKTDSTRTNRYITTSPLRLIFTSQKLNRTGFLALSREHRTSPSKCIENPTTP